MKARRIIIIALFIFTIFIISVYAHSGRTDSYGGHWNHKTGEYHYHGSSDISEWVFYGFIAGIEVIVLFVWIIKTAVVAKKEEQLRLQREKEAKIQFENERIKYMEMYAGKDILQLCGCPEGTYLGNDGLPKTDGEGEYGLYTVYVTRSAVTNKGVSYYHHHTHNYKYHIKPNCCNLFLCPSNIAKHPNIQPCMKCAYKHNVDLSWYEKYKEIMVIKKTYDIP